MVADVHVRQALSQARGEIGPMRRWTPSDYSATYHSTSALLAWYCFGKQCFMISPLLKDSLINTDVDDVPVEHVKVPYKAIWVGCDHRWPSGWHSRGFVIIQGDATDTVADLEKQASKGLDSLSMTGKDFLIITSLSDKSHVEASGSHDTMSRVLVLDGATVGECLRNTYDRLQSWEHEERTKQIMKYMINVLLYLSMPKGDRQRVTYGAPIGKKRVSCNTELVGYRITRIRKEFSEPTAVAIDGRRKPRLHFVRGHWRSYWCGSGDGRHTELRWLSPFWRGGGGVVERIAYTS